MQVQQMMSTHPQAPRKANDALLRCIEECYSCAQTCTACADACLAEEAVAELRLCIRLNLDCADLCATIGRIVSRGTGLNEALLAEILNTCALVCRLCGDECERHAPMHEHCRLCAAACRSCAEACGEAIRSLRAAG
jgi:Domain of Unknown Function (DUF326)